MTKEKDRILAYNMAEKIPLEILKNISGGGNENKNGTRNACVEYTQKDGASDTQVNVYYDW